MRGSIDSFLSPMRAALECGIAIPRVATFCEVGTERRIHAELPQSLRYNFVSSDHELEQTVATDFIYLNETLIASATVDRLSKFWENSRQGLAINVTIENAEEKGELINSCIQKFTRGVSLVSMGTDARGYVLCLYRESFMEWAWPRTPRVESEKK